MNSTQERGFSTNIFNCMWLLIKRCGLNMSHATTKRDCSHMFKNNVFVHFNTKHVSSIVHPENLTIPIIWTTTLKFNQAIPKYCNNDATFTLLTHLLQYSGSLSDWWSFTHLIHTHAWTHPACVYGLTMDFLPHRVTTHNSCRSKLILRLILRKWIQLDSSPFPPRLHYNTFGPAFWYFY